MKLSTYQDMISFLVNYCVAYETVKVYSSNAAAVEYRHKREDKTTPTSKRMTLLLITSPNKCIISMFPVYCKKPFGTFVKRHTLWLKCLSPGLFVSECPCSLKCRFCNVTLHSLLHLKHDSQSSEKPNLVTPLLSQILGPVL